MWLWCARASFSLLCGSETSQHKPEAESTRTRHQKYKILLDTQIELKMSVDPVVVVVIGGNNGNNGHFSDIMWQNISSTLYRCKILSWWRTDESTFTIFRVFRIRVRTCNTHAHEYHSAHSNFPYCVLAHKQFRNATAYVTTNLFEIPSCIDLISVVFILIMMFVVFLVLIFFFFSTLSLSLSFALSHSLSLPFHRI